MTLSQGWGTVAGGGRADHSQGLRDLRGGGARAEPTYTTDRGVMDNLGAHRPKRIGQLIERQGCELLYLCRPTPPTTQPHRRGLRQAKTTAAPQGRVQEQRGPGRSDSSGALSAITTADAKGFFEHAGYRPAGQLP